MNKHLYILLLLFSFTASHAGNQQECIHNNKGNTVTDTLIAHCYSRSETLYIEVKDSPFNGLVRNWNIRRDTLDENLIEEIKKSALKTRNTFYKHYSKFDSLKNLTPEELSADYKLNKKINCKVKNCLFHLEESDYPLNYSLKKHRNETVTGYYWSPMDKISGIDLIFWDDSVTGKPLIRIFRENYELLFYTPRYQKKLDMDIPAFFNNTILTQDEYISYNGGYDVTSFYSDFYQRDTARLMRMEMDEALEKIGKPVGILSFYYGPYDFDTIRPPERPRKEHMTIDEFIEADLYQKRNTRINYSVGFVETTTDSLRQLASSDIGCDKRFEYWDFERYFQNTYNDLQPKNFRKLVWLRDQTSYVSVYYFEKDGKWKPVEIIFWSDW